MIVTSVCDPALFDPSLLENKYAMDSLTSTLRNMMQYHLPVIDSGDAISKATQKRLQDHPALQMRYSALLQPGRIVRIPADISRVQRLEEWIGSEPATAVACSENPIVDVLLASDDTLAAMTEENIDSRKTVALHNFSGSCWFKDDSCKKIGGMTKEQFLSEIIRPVVRCAEKVTIIDKMIIRAAFGDGGNPSGKPGANWSSFKKSILAVHDEWVKGLHQGNGLFEIITWPVTHVQKDGKALLKDDLAKELGKRLSIPFSHLRVIFKSEHKFRADMHDRYLVTNQGIVLGFSKGFDLFASNTLGTCDVYLRKPDSLISMLMSPSNDCGKLEPKKK
ncbi:hypothetical protein P4B35_03895 [Pontiellaceae bacterium B12227]|nr:hypothetical protein [Pontiellaceae bacterium B12227]